MAEQSVNIPLVGKQPKKTVYIGGGLLLVVVLYALYKRKQNSAAQSTSAQIQGSATLDPSQQSGTDQAFEGQLQGLQSELQGLSQLSPTGAGSQINPSAPTSSGPNPVSQTSGALPQMPISMPAGQPTTSAALQGMPSESAIAAQLGNQSLSPQQLNALSVLEQPQNQPTVNPQVNAAPVTQPTSLGPATGVGQRYVTPGPNPYAYTYG